uniref:Uncharacterized protein n=1 Tax=Ixodes ricinus TaxID=34613 RepID=A0A6B0ULV2_IXORI
MAANFLAVALPRADLFAPVLAAAGFLAAPLAPPILFAVGLPAVDFSAAFGLPALGLVGLADFGLPTPGFCPPVGLARPPFGFGAAGRPNSPVHTGASFRLGSGAGTWFWPWALARW